MPRAIFIAADASVHVADVATGYAAMEGARRIGVPGIRADCGGGCACATCHVHVDAAWTARVGPPGAQEADMLQFARDVCPTSRLSCQIIMRDSLDGIVLNVVEQD